MFSHKVARSMKSIKNTSEVGCSYLFGNMTYFGGDYTVEQSTFQ